MHSAIRQGDSRGGSCCGPPCFGVGDAARPNERADLEGGFECRPIPVPTRLMFELVLEEIERPIRILPATQRFADQHFIPSEFLLIGETMSLRLAIDDEPELVIDEVAILTAARCWLPTTMHARRGNHHR